MIDPTAIIERKAPLGKFRVIAYLQVGEGVPQENYLLRDCDSLMEATTLVRSSKEQQTLEFNYMVFDDQGKKV